MLKQIGYAFVAVAGSGPGALAQEGPGIPFHDHMWGGHGMGYGLFGGGLSLLFWLIFLVLIVLGIRWAVQGEAPWAGRRRNSALDILQERLAKGEIDPEEYQQRKQALED